MRTFARHALPEVDPRPAAPLVGESRNPNSAPTSISTRLLIRPSRCGLFGASLTRDPVRKGTVHRGGSRNAHQENIESDFGLPERFDHLQSALRASKRF